MSFPRPVRNKQWHTAAGLCEAVIMTPMTLPPNFFERKAAMIPVRKMTESSKSALQMQRIQMQELINMRYSRYIAWTWACVTRKPDFLLPEPPSSSTSCPTLGQEWVHDQLPPFVSQGQGREGSTVRTLFVLEFVNDTTVLDSVSPNKRNRPAFTDPHPLQADTGER